MTRVLRLAAHRLMWVFSTVYLVHRILLFSKGVRYTSLYFDRDKQENGLNGRYVATQILLRCSEQGALSGNVLPLDTQTNTRTNS